MQSCPKNGHTGPLIGDSKRSNISSIAKESMLLPPVALALPLEPASATGPPSPARGSAGMPPPPSPAGATYQAPPTPKRETPEPLDTTKSSPEKRRKARVGKSVVRNNLHLHQNTMLLMCQEPPVQNLYQNPVKREVESPKEEQKREAIPDIIQSHVEPVAIIEVENVSSTVDIKEITSSQITSSTNTDSPSGEISMQTDLKTETSDSEQNKEIAIGKATAEEVIEPCLKTVAENVKVKNMKRKLSVVKSAEPTHKKQMLEKSPQGGCGSYKDLIRRNVSAVHIHNGKKKLLVNRSLVHRLPKIRLKKPNTKRKVGQAKEDACKRTQHPKPLIASSLHNSKQNNVDGDKTSTRCELVESKQSAKRNSQKKQVNSKCPQGGNGKKLAPAILDSLFARNSVDLTIESVVSDGLRTGGRSSANPSRTSSTERGVKVSNELKKEPCASNNNNNNKSAPNAKVSSAKGKVKCSQKGGKKKPRQNATEVPVVIAKYPVRRNSQFPRWSNGWTWKGEPFESKVFLNVSSFSSTLLFRTGKQSAVTSMNKL